MKARRLVLLIPLFLIATTQAQPSFEKVYTANECAFLASDGPDNNVPEPVWLGWYGVQGNSPTNVYHGLIKFSDMDIPQGATIISATLTMGTSIWAAQGPVTVTIHSLLKPYNTGTGPNGTADTGEVTWNSVAHNQELWEVPGANGATDAAPAEDPCMVWVPYPGGNVDYDFTASLQQQADSGNFYGWIMKPLEISGTDLGLFSGGAPTAPPELTVEYQLPCEPLPTDFNEDCITDLRDLAIFVSEWLQCSRTNWDCP